MNNSLKWFYIGDIGLFNNSLLKLLLTQQRTDNKFIIILGDNFYPHGIDSQTKDQWRNIIHINKILNTPMLPILGNHDYHLDPYEQIKKTNFNWIFPNFYYGYQHTVGDIKIGFWLIDTQILTLDGPDIDKDLIENRLKKNAKQEQLKHIQWLEKTLQLSNADIKIVNGHYPMYSNGNYGNNPDLIKILLPLFKKNNVQFYFSGHDHNFQHIKKNFPNNYTLNQFICGSSSEIRPYDNGNRDDVIIHKHIGVECVFKNRTLNILARDSDNNIAYQSRFVI